MGSLYDVVQLQNISYCWQQQNVQQNSTYSDNRYPDRLGPSGKFVDNSTKLACLEIIGRGKGKGLPQQAEVAQGFPGRLRPRIFLTFGTTRVVGRQPYASAAFTPEKIPDTHFFLLC
jgi:hypothetical protein